MPQRGNGYTNRERPTYDMTQVERRCVWLEEHESFAAVTKREEKDGWRAVDKAINRFNRTLILQRARPQALPGGQPVALAPAVPRV